jgi:enoyl-CoA hydratase
MADQYDNIEIRHEDDVFEIRLDRPDQLNAVNEELHAELTSVFSDAYDADARVVVLTGNGDAFCAGGDINWMKESVEDPSIFRETVREGEEIIQSLLNVEKPIVARVNGDATGLGATLALFCDIVVMDEDARIGDPHVKVGLVAGDGGAVIWPLLTSLNTAKELLMTGELLTAAEAEDIGLVNHVVPGGELDETVDEVVDKLATGPQTAIRYTKVVLTKWIELGNTVALREGMGLEAISQQHPDHEEAVDAFREGRRPEFPSARPREE